LGQFACTTGVTAAAAGVALPPVSPMPSASDGLEELHPATMASSDMAADKRKI